jgi:hypothetical protein
MPRALSEAERTRIDAGLREAARTLIIIIPSNETTR